VAGRGGRLMAAPPAPPEVRPLPLGEINAHVECMRDVLGGWFHDHRRLTTRQLPLETFLSWLHLQEALEQFMVALDDAESDHGSHRTGYGGT
jgi:hypothetical protein